MKLKKSLFVLLLLLLAACNDLSLPQDSYEVGTLTPLPTQTLEPTMTPIPDAAEGAARAFYRAWEGRDYAAMYSYLSPQSQALVNGDAFITLYEESMATAAVRAIHTKPQAAFQEGQQAQMTMRVTWDTAIVGSITRDHTVNLAYGDGRWGVVWDEGLILPEMEGGQRLQMDYRIPARANIYDVGDQALAYQGTAITLGVVPGEIEDEEGLLEILSRLLDLPPEEIQAKYASALADWYVPLGDISGEAMQANAESLRPYLDAGLRTEERLTRIYPDGGIAPHIVGYVGFIPAGEEQEYRLQGYRGDEKVGLAGVEAWGEPYLRGTRGGVLTIVGPNGEYVTTVAETEPRQARSVYTTLEADFQDAVEQALAQALRSHPIGRAGSVVVMNVADGTIKAMASYPSYNPAIFDATRPGAGEELTQVLNDPGRPLVNRAAQGAYPAGSIFKVVTLSAGLNSGLYTPNTLYTSTGSWDRLGENFVKYDWREGGHGTVTMRQALTVSCNSCFYDMGYELDAYDPNLLPSTARQFGLGQPTGIEGIEEAGGTIPDQEWKLATQGEGWARGDAVNMAIGQGFVQVTPLQMVNIFAAIANGGTLYQPRLIDRIGAGGGAPEEPWPTEVNGQLPLSPEYLDTIRLALQEVTTANYGTATHRFQNFPVPVAGKTGTAEAPGSGTGEPHAWFAGYAPAGEYTRRDGTLVDGPEIAVIAMVENAGEGSAVAAPIFRRIVELYYGITPLTPFPWEQPS